MDYGSQEKNHAEFNSASKIQVFKNEKNGKGKDQGNGGGDNMKVGRYG